MLSESLLAGVALSTLKAIAYLKSELKYMHRDIKPGNILANEHGDIKLCDFSVGGKLVASCANSNVGTLIYMSPERIDVSEGGDASYGVAADVWSLGITLTELALGHYPYRCVQCCRPCGLRVVSDAVLTWYVCSENGPGQPYKEIKNIFNVLSTIVKAEAPTLPAACFSPELRDFLALW